MDRYCKRAVEVARLSIRFQQFRMEIQYYQFVENTPVTQMFVLVTLKAFVGYKLSHLHEYFEHLHIQNGWPAYGWRMKCKNKASGVKVQV